MKNVIKISITTLGTLAILGTSTLAVTGIVNAPSGLVLREEASKTANPVTTVPDKTEVDIIEKNGEWYKVNYGTSEGYLFAEYVNSKEEVAPTPDENEEQPTKDNNIQAASKLKVYNMPLITSTIINEIDAEAEITVIKEITNWSYVSAGNIEGWVRTYGIRNTTQEPINPSEEPEKNPEETKPEQEQTETTVPETEKPSEPSEPTVSEPEEDKPTYNEPSNSEQTEGTSSASKGFIAVDSATVRKEPTTSSEVVTYLIKDTSFTIKAETEEWYKIVYEDIEGTVYEGYIYKQLVTI